MPHWRVGRDNTEYIAPMYLVDADWSLNIIGKRVVEQIISIDNGLKLVLETVFPPDPRSRFWMFCCSQRLCLAATCSGRKAHAFGKLLVIPLQDWFVSRHLHSRKQ